MPPAGGRIARRSSAGAAPISDTDNSSLDKCRRDAGLSHGELWLRYFELGGMRTALELEAVLYGALVPDNHDHDVLAHTLNERFVELGGNHPVPYQADGPAHKPH